MRKTHDNTYSYRYTRTGFNLQQVPFRRFYLVINVRVREQALSLLIALYKTSARKRDKDTMRAHIHKVLEHRISDIRCMSKNGTYSVDFVHSLYAELPTEAD